jgi:transcriptional regulator with XRE-family HTH domain
MRGRRTTKDNVITERLNTLLGDSKLRELANQIGVGQSTLHNYLRGRIPPATFIKQVSERCGVSSDWLLGVKGFPNSELQVLSLTNYIAAQTAENQRLLKELGTGMGGGVKMAKNRADVAKENRLAAKIGGIDWKPIWAMIRGKR